MKWCHLLAATAPIIGLQSAVSAPAHASAAVVLGLPLATLSALAERAPELPATTCANSTTAPFEPGAAFAKSKSSAILGGALSRLDLVSLQQSSLAGQPDTVIGKKVEPAAGGMRCQLERSWSVTAIPTRNRSAGSREDFLASARLPLRRTNFDAQWNSVRRSGLSPRVVSSLAGTGKPGKATLAVVNAWSNARIRYKDDRDLYGKADYWATASATLRRGAGDCEDIAIVKMQALAALGVPRSDMYLTIARDTIRNADHALLVVKLDGRHWLLDNATDTLLDASESYDYRPIMSFSTSGKWLHGYELPSSRLLASR